MCFHIGPEFVEVLTSRTANKSAVSTSSVFPDSTYPSKGQEHPPSSEDLASRLREFILSGVTIKWLLFLLWVCL